MATKCPVCGVSVKLENLERHVTGQHPRAKVDFSRELTDEQRQELEAKRAAARPHLTRGGRRLILVTTIVMVAILVLIIVNPFGNTGIDPGKVAPDFSLPTSDSGTISLSSLQGRPVLLEFMDIDCPHCINEARDVLPFLFQNYSTRVAFLSVDVNFIGASDTAGRVNAFKSAYGTNWPYALDNGAVTGAYHVSSTPTIYVLDRNRVVVTSYVGEEPYATLAAGLDQALGG
ncbi:MAG TPA: TlpA disulfide reductase family protein [Thermoplasmata archaeon]|nr:TlpA disulfide reductase family protein [Thermoplasmata archaeon]